MRLERTGRTARSTTGRLTFVGCVLAGAAAMTLSGCSTSSSSSGSGGGGSSGAALPQSKNAHATGDLTVWIRGAGDSPKAYKKIFDAFTAQSGIKVNIATATLTDFETKLTAAASAHRLPDVVVDDAAQLGNFESQGILLPVDKSKFAGADQLTDLAWKSATDLKGQAYAVPFSAQANVLLVRKDWLDKYNLQPPKTWDDLAKVAKAFTTPTTYGLAVPGSTARGYTAWYWSSFLYQAGGDFVKSAGDNKYTASVDSSQAVQAAQFLENQVCTAKDVQPSVLGDDTTATNKAFQTGVAGLYLTGPYAYATMDATSVKGKYIVIPPPTGPSGQEATLAEGTDIFTMADAKTDEATKLEEFMVTPAALRDHQPLEIIAEGSVMQQGTQAIYTMPNSKIKTLTELKGHLLGINAPSILTTCSPPPGAHREWHRTDPGALLYGRHRGGLLCRGPRPRRSRQRRRRRR